MELQDIFREIVEDLPWVESTRLLVGPLCSREAVKDELLKKTPILPSWAVGTIGDLASEIASKKKPLEKPLGLASQCDALATLASNAVLKSKAPELCSHLKARPVAAKIARFLTHLEKFYVHEEDLVAIVEYFQQKDPQLGSFVEVVAALWSQGQLSPWGEGHVLRSALAILAEERQPLPEKIYLWGFSEFSPIEEALLEQLARHGARIELLIPETLLGLFTPRCEAIGIRAQAMQAAPGEREIWEPHSVWDELAFLREELAQLKTRNVAWDEVAIFVPGDDLYKRLVRQKLLEWNVPIHDPTLSGGWKDKPQWIWWRDFLRTIAGGLKLDEVRALLGPGEDRKALFDAAFARGIHGSAGQWAKLGSLPPELETLIEGVRIFSSSMLPTEFRKATETFVPLVESKLEGCSGALLLEFATHLAEERPYLESFRGRLPKYVALFEEYLETKSRTESLRAQHGVHFLAHGVWLPIVPSHAFVLGSHAISRAKVSADLWDFEGLEVRRAWEKLHFGLPWAERVARDEEFLRYSLGTHRKVVFSALEYDLGGKPVAKSSFFQKQKAELESVRSGGHGSVGWQDQSQALTDRPKLEVLCEPSLAVPADKPVRVSSFEDYLKCPFLYFARHVLKIVPEEELGLDPDGRARGNILHKSLKRFIETEIAGQPLGTIESERVRLHAIIEEEVKAEKLSGMFRHAPLIGKAISLIKSQADRWLEWEYENRKRHSSLKPFLVEKPLEFELNPGFRLSGRPDRVDSDGTHSVVIDYKTGQSPFIGRELKEGLGAQLLMYSKAMESTHKLEPAAAYYVSLGRKVDGTKGVFVEKHNKKLHTTHPRNTGLHKGEFETLFEQATSNWQRAAENLKKGEFSPNPARGEKECSSCHYSRICGYRADPEESISE